jgi:DNA modification methylase
MTEWLKWYKKRVKNKLYSLAVFKLDQRTYEQSGYNDGILTDFILKAYDSLENYRHLAIVVDGEIFNKEEQCITWNLMYKAGIYAENFIQYKEKFSSFHKDKQVQSLVTFLKSRGVSSAESLAESFYESISTGLQYKDCYISDDQRYKILIYRKVVLDDSNVPCPSCNTMIESKNSCTEMFLRSWECKNPSCPDRSKSGRGKRFDEYSTYRYFKLCENDKDNKISQALYKQFRRDIFKADSDWCEFLIKEYTYAGEKILCKNHTPKQVYKRKLVEYDLDSLKIVDNAIKVYEDIPVLKFIQGVLRNKSVKTGTAVLTKEIELINDDSTEYLQSLKAGQVGTVMTSPPYYNVREYSQWDTLLMYLVDMAISSKVVYNTLSDGAYYLYNVGDVVVEDNIYVKANMSKHRIQLGFLSAMLFEEVGYCLTGNIIWDKGEVQSKRSVTTNMIAGYVRCVNCYEHVLVFRKGQYERVSNTVERITPVIKINSKGENIRKHTAPYPIGLVELAEKYRDETLYLLDPFLGSGTTLEWVKGKNIRGLGVEKNREYYESSKRRLEV